MQRERKRRFGVNAIISQTDDGVDAETSLSLSLHLYLSSPLLHFLLTLTSGMVCTRGGCVAEKEELFDRAQSRQAVICFDEQNSDS